VTGSQRKEFVARQDKNATRASISQRDFRRLSNNNDHNNKLHTLPITRASWPRIEDHGYSFPNDFLRILRACRISFSRSLNILLLRRGIDHRRLFQCHHLSFFNPSSSYEGPLYFQEFDSRRDHLYGFPTTLLPNTLGNLCILGPYLTPEPHLLSTFQSRLDARQGHAGIEFTYCS